VGVSPILINDTTLRDGEQSAGIAFDLQEKVAIALALDAIGIHEIEVGIPVMGGDEADAIREIVNLGLRADLLGWNRAVVTDISASMACGLRRVHISIPVSEIQIQAKFQGDRHRVLQHLQDAMSFAMDHGLFVSVGGEDSSRAEASFLLDIALQAEAWGAQRFRFCDTVGILDPFSTFEQVQHLVKGLAIPVEMHTHDDLGMATANAIAGIRAGATSVNTTVNGLGERAGNAALEEVVMALKRIYGLNLGITTQRLSALSNLVQQATGDPLPRWKAVVGQNAFTHEAGIHADGILHDPMTYAAFSPDEVGCEHRLVAGKHSGRHLIHYLLQQRGIVLNDEQERSLLERVRHESARLKRSLTDEELLALTQ
jgi:homocitrate synthase NifV